MRRFDTIKPLTAKSSLHDEHERSRTQWFDIMQKELPKRHAPLREVGGYSSRSNATTVTAIFRIRLNSFSESTTSNRTENHLLSMKPEANPQRLAFGFVLVDSENMRPRKSAPPVYTEVA
jgi:hypothetical protein